MYRREEVNKFRKRCHPKNKNDLEQHQPLFTRTAKENYSTDCHGKHRLAKRRTEWK
jgi:aminoglycoside phosphotransferase family enzyme